MGSHPLNLAIRFILELITLAVFGIWGWRYGSEGWLQYIMALGIPTVAAIIWGVFNVPNDPSRSGKAPVVINGAVRLLLEFTFFAMATWALYDMGYTKGGLLFGVIALGHYLLSYDRIVWLLKQ